MNTANAKTPHGEIHELLHDLENVECWNSSKGTPGTLKKGSKIKVLHAYDSTQTTILASTSNPNEEPELPSGGITLQDGSTGYRFIVPNTMLAQAIGLPMPETTPDLISDIIAYESGEMDEARSQSFLQELQKSGLASKLQGHYSSRCAT